MGCASYRSARIFMIIASILLGWWAVAFLVLNIFLAKNQALNLEVTSKIVYLILIIIGAALGGIFIINGFVIGIVLGWTPQKTWWMKWLMALYQILLWLFVGAIAIYLAFFLLIEAGAFTTCKNSLLTDDQKAAWG